MSPWLCWLLFLTATLVTGTAATWQEASNGFVATSQHMCMLDVNTMNFSCISNSDQLCALFKNTLTSNMYRVGGFSLLLFHMHIQMAALQSSSNASSHLENRCCEASDTQDICRTTAVYFHAIFEALPYPLMKMFTSNLISHVFSKAEAASIEEICWTPPLPFCLGSHTDDIINHFLHQWMKCGTLNQYDQHQIYIAPFHLEKLDSIPGQWALVLYALVLCLALVILKVLPMMKKNRQVFHPVNPRSKSLLFAAMLHFWAWFMWLYLYQFLALFTFQKVINTKTSVISTAYMPFADIGYYAFGIMGVFYLVEFPFLLWYIRTKVMVMDRRSLNRRQCMLTMLKSVGCAGMVLFMQVLPVYLIFHIVFFFISPLLVLQKSCTYLVVFSFFTICTAPLFLPCIIRCKRCLPNCCSIGFFILCILISLAFLFIMSKEFQADTYNTLYDLGHILTVLFTSGLIALLAYIIKLVFTHRKDAGCPHDTITDEGYSQLLDAA